MRLLKRDIRNINQQLNLVSYNHNTLKIDYVFVFTGDQYSGVSGPPSGRSDDVAKGADDVGSQSVGGSLRPKRVSGGLLKEKERN